MRMLVLLMVVASLFLLTAGILLGSLGQTGWLTASAELVLLGACNAVWGVVLLVLQGKVERLEHALVATTERATV